ncbi:MAG: hypothetical protein Q8N79_06705 [Candidatus Methanoperedens sp.]|nr:hypothetical protein [Candidatus Methanoperedens sp.]
MPEKINGNKCMGCGIDLTGKKRYPVYSPRLAVLGYRCGECHEKSKSPATKKREEEISHLTKEIPRLENPNMDIRKSLNK